MEIQGAIARVLSSDPYKIVLSSPVDRKEPKTTVTRKRDFFQSERIVDGKAFQKNISFGDMQAFLTETAKGYRQINAFSDGFEHMVYLDGDRVTYKRKATDRKAPEAQAHDREKNYVIKDGTLVPPLVDMGVMTPEGRVKAPMHDKFRQINRYLEVVQGEIGNMGRGRLNVIDFGCGKSYLTFVVYWYLTEVEGLECSVTGLDLKGDVIERCNATAKKYGYDGMRFLRGDIKDYDCPEGPLDLVMTLHACDTATDFALYNAVRWGARVILSVPCCQHELNAQMKSANFPLLSRYGIVKERFSSLATDAIRASLLEYSGYKTDLLEFVDFEHTPKNILIRARRRPYTPEGTKERARREAEDLMREFSFRPTLYNLLFGEEEARDGRL